MEFEVDEIRYKVNEDGITVSVIRKYFKKYEGEVVIPSSVEYNGNEYSVNAIGWNVFNGCSTLMNVIIPDSVTVIGGGAFDGTHFYNNLPDGLVYFGKILYKYKGEMPNGTKVRIKEGVVCVSPNAFKDCSGLTSIVIPDSVTVIGRDAFSGCISLTSVVIPDSVTWIGNWAFHGCSGLESIVIGEGNPAYDSRENCNAIIETKTNKLIRGCKNTIIPDSVTEIGDYAFSGCGGLTSIVIPDLVTAIGQGSFGLCSSLTRMVIPDSVADIGKVAFFGCSGLTSVVIPDSVTKIAERTFGGCSGLRSIAIPNSVTEIEGRAFYGCQGLESIVVEKGNPAYDSRENCNAIIEIKTNKLIRGCKNTIIPNSVTAIGDWAFDGCSGLTSVVIPDSVTEIGYKAFSGCSGLTSVVIPDSVTEIGNGAFDGCSGLTSVVIPDSVTAIGDWAFKGCSGLETIIVGKGNQVYDSRENCNAIIETRANILIIGCKNTVIPDSVTEIGDWAFCGCSGLTSVVIPDSVTEIGDYAFSGCSGLTSVVIPDSVTEIGDSAFDGCSGLTSVVIPDSVTYIGVGAFCGCSDLTSVVIPDSVTAIGVCAFLGCSGLTSVVIPDSVTEIGDSAFYGCSGLTSVVIPDSVTAIGDWAFEGCSGLTSVVIPDSVTKVGKEAFRGCSGLRSVVIPDSVTEIRPESFKGCSGLTNVVIPDSVTAIGDSAFDGCSGLSSVVIPDSVTEIGNYAFSGCSGLTSVVIPDSVTEISHKAFKGCSGLTTLAYNAEGCGLGEGVVGDCDNLSTIVVGENVKFIPNELMEVGSLNRVIVLAQEPPKCEALIPEKNNITVFVPKEAYVRYWLDEYWRGFNLCEFVPVDGINLSRQDVYLGLNYDDRLSVTISPMNATHKEVIWKSDNPSVVTVDQSGYICGVSRGTANIIVEALDGSGVKAKCKVRVGEILAESVVVKPSSVRLEINRFADINCCFLPENAHNKAVEWSTTDAGVVAFRKNSDGSISVIGVSAGHAKILCKALDGGGACGVCEVVVENR